MFKVSSTANLSATVKTVLATCAYIDLNPVAAGIVDVTESSPDTSIRSDSSPHTNKAAPLRCTPQASAAWPDQKRWPAWTNQSGSARAKINAHWILSVRAWSRDSRWAAIFPVVSYRFFAMTGGSSARLAVTGAALGM